MGKKTNRTLIVQLMLRHIWRKNGQISVSGDRMSGKNQLPFPVDRDGDWQ